METRTEIKASLNKLTIKDNDGTNTILYTSICKTFCLICKKEEI